MGVRGGTVRLGDAGAAARAAGTGCAFHDGAVETAARRIDCAAWYAPRLVFEPRRTLHCAAMQGRLLLGAGALLALVWWFAGSRVVAGFRTSDEAVAATLVSGPPPTGVVLDEPGPPQRAPVVATVARPGEPATRARDILVVDAARRPIAGAEISTGGVYRSDGSRGDWGDLATTDANGHARIEMRAEDGVSVCAPGFRLAYAHAPGPDVEWVVALARALRLEITVEGQVDCTGLHARVDLPRDCREGPFYQSKYQQTPGRAVAGTVARWTHERVPDGTAAWISRSFWSLCLPAAGPAVLDQIDTTGIVKVQLLRFAKVLEERQVEITPDSGPARLLFRIAPTEPLRGIVVDAAGHTLADVQLRMAPHGGQHLVDSPTGGEAFPVWAPATRSDAHGRFTLPRPDAEGERIVVSSPGHAARAVTVAELVAAQGVIELQPARTVRIEILDCNGKPLEGGWTTGGHEYAEPSVLLGHDVWRGTSDRELPWFEFAELPPASVTFRCAGEQLHHDARVPQARMVTEGPVEELGIGK